MMYAMPKMAYRVSITNDHTLSSRMKGNLPVRFGAAVREAIPLSTVTTLAKMTLLPDDSMKAYKATMYDAGLRLKI